MEKFNNILSVALNWQTRGEQVAIATVIKTWGSSPRPVGSQLVINGNKEIFGSVSGGCVEGAVIEEAMICMATDKSVVLKYEVTDQDAFAVNLTCGGKIEILIQVLGKRFPLDLLRALIKKIEKKEPTGYVVDKNFENSLLISSNEKYSKNFLEDKSGFVEEKFSVIYNPPLILSIVGGVHIAQPLAEIANLAGFDVVIIDPRSAFANKARFPNYKIVNLWPDEAFELYRPNSRMAVVTLTHDPKIDDLAIIKALKSSCFYIGCLGSIKTHEKRLERLKAMAFSRKSLKRLHGPVGLSIKALTPVEISVSIIAEIIKVLRQTG
tara:strand:+ start:902 stop:1870 length:969 start_codon:yes stop_codon:yes gene_type:complete